jgi:hypothetical protein
LLGLFLDAGDVPPKRRLTFNGLHGVISQKIELFITTAVRTSNPTNLNCNNSELTPWDRVFLEKLAKKVPASYKAQAFSNIFTRIRF